MTEIRKRIMQMGSKKAEIPFFSLAYANYIDTHITENCSHTLGIEFSQPTPSGYYMGVANRPNDNYHSIQRMYSGSADEGKFRAYFHTGIRTVTLLSTYIVQPNTFCTVELSYSGEHFGLKINGVEESSYPSTQYYTGSYTYVVGAINLAGTVTYKANDMNIRHAWIKNSSGTYLYDLVPKMLNGAYAPFDNVTGQFVTIL